MVEKGKEQGRVMRGMNTWDKEKRGRGGKETDVGMLGSDKE